MAYGAAFRDANPDRARESMRRGLVIAQDSGTHALETHLAYGLALLESNSGDPLAALGYFAAAIRSYHDSGNTVNMRSALAGLAACLCRIERYGPAATLAGFAFDPLTAAWLPEVDITITQLRDVLGNETYESLARKGETMATASVATYAYDQIDQAKTELKAVPQ